MAGRTRSRPKNQSVTSLHRSHKSCFGRVRPSALTHNYAKIQIHTTPSQTTIVLRHHIERLLPPRHPRTAATSAPPSPCGQRLLITVASQPSAVRLRLIDGLDGQRPQRVHATLQNSRTSATIRVHTIDARNAGHSSTSGHPRGTESALQSQCERPQHTDIFGVVGAVVVAQEACRTKTTDAGRVCSADRRCITNGERCSVSGRRRRAAVDDVRCCERTRRAGGNHRADRGRR